MKVLRIGIALLILAVVFLLSLRAQRNIHYFWFSCSGHISLDDEPVPDTSVRIGSWQSPSDLLLVDVRKQQGVIYLVNLTSHHVSELNVSDYLYATSPPSDSALKPVTATDIVVEEWHVEFTTPNGSRIRVRWMANL
jgi:hypothetical protein